MPCFGYRAEIFPRQPVFNIAWVFRRRHRGVPSRSGHIGDRSGVPCMRKRTAALDPEVTLWFPITSFHSNGRSRPPRNHHELLQRHLSKHGKRRSWPTWAWPVEPFGTSRWSGGRLSLRRCRCARWPALPFVPGTVPSWREFLRTMRRSPRRSTGLLWLRHRLGARCALLRKVWPGGGVSCDPARLPAPLPQFHAQAHR